MTPGQQSAVSFSLTRRTAKAKKQGDLYVKCLSVLLLMARSKRLPTVSLCYSVSSHGELRARLAKELPESEFGIGWALEAIYVLPRKGDAYHPKQGTGRKNCHACFRVLKRVRTESLHCLALKK